MSNIHGFGLMIESCIYLQPELIVNTREIDEIEILNMCYLIVILNFFHFIEYLSKKEIIFY